MIIAMLAAQLAVLDALLAPVAKPVTPRAYRIAKAGGIRAGKTRDYRRAIRNYPVTYVERKAYDDWMFEHKPKPQWTTDEAWELTEEAIDILLDELGGDLINREPKAYSDHGKYRTWA